MNISLLFLLCSLSFYSCSANILTRIYTRHLQPMISGITKGNYRIDRGSHPEVEKLEGHFLIKLIPANAIYTVTLYADDNFRFLLDGMRIKTNGHNNLNIQYSTTPESSPKLSFYESTIHTDWGVGIGFINIYPLPNPSQKTTYLIDCSSITGKSQNSFLEITIEPRPRNLPPAPITPQTDNPKNPIMHNNTVDLGKISHKYLLTLKPGNSFLFTIPNNQHASSCEGNNTFSFSLDNHTSKEHVTVTEQSTTPTRTYHVTIPNNIIQKNSYSILLKRDSLFSDNHGCGHENQATLGILEIIVIP